MNRLSKIGNVVRILLLPLLLLCSLPAEAMLKAGKTSPRKSSAAAPPPVGPAHVPAASSAPAPSPPPGSGAGSAAKPVTAKTAPKPNPWGNPLPDSIKKAGSNNPSNVHVGSSSSSGGGGSLQGASNAQGQSQSAQAAGGGAADSTGASRAAAAKSSAHAGPAGSSAPTKFITFYHGTTKFFASRIRKHGIDLTRGRSDIDFGQGFYTTTDLRQARQWANKLGQQRRDGGGEVLVFNVPESEFNALKHREFTSDAELLAHVLAGRRGEISSHAQDVTSGKMLMNPGESTPVLKGQQTAWHTPNAVELLNKSLQK